jgi:oligopeptide transport system substrate-binding protein
VRALDELTLLVEMEGPTSYFPQLLTYIAFHPVPRHVVEAHGEVWGEMEHLVTNGPFILERWQPRHSILLVRNPEYRGEFTGNVQEVVLILNVEKSAEWLAMYEADDLDIVFLPSSPEGNRVRQRRAEEYLSGPSLNTQYISFNVRRPPFDDPRVRRAFAMAIDKERFASVVFSGYDFPATGGFVPPGMPGHSPGIGLPYDPEQARGLLAEAGYPGGRDFPTVECLGRSLNDKIGLDYLRAQWRENLGIDIKWQITEWGAMLDRLDREPPHLFIMGWTVDYPDPDNPLRVSAHRSWTGWQNESYTELVERARRITDHAERMKLYQQADRILIEEAAVVPVLYGRYHFLVKPWVRKFSLSAVSWTFWKDVIVETHP